MRCLSANRSSYGETVHRSKNNFIGKRLYSKEERSEKQEVMKKDLFSQNVIFIFPRNLDNSTIARARTVLIQSSSSSGRAQPSDSPLCAHYSNEKSNGKTRKRRKGTAAPTVLEYNIHYIPRILKNDLRRQYPMIFTNVFNSCDANQIKLMLQTFARPDVRNIMEFSGKCVADI